MNHAQRLRLVICLSLAIGPYALNAQYAAPPSAAAEEATNAKAHLLLARTGSNENLHITIGQSTILHTASVMKRIFVGNPAVLGTFTSAPDEVIVTAKAVGASSLIVWDADGQEHLYAVSSDIDPAGLAAALGQQYPGSSIAVEATQDRVTLSGSVPTRETADAAVKTAGLYAKEVLNALRVQPLHGKQVQLKLRIAEVDRTKLEQFGVNFTKAAGSNVLSTSTNQFASAITAAAGSVTAADPLNLFFFNGAHDLGVTIQDLESKNIIQILAEPNLTTLSGLPARFLSGGEFPFPVVEGSSGGTPVISIQFKPYGVRVDFTPIANEDGTIRLKISPEVSSLDYSNAVSISGFTIPALSTRRTETEVELRDGQSFALSGLLDRQVTDSLSKIPGIADIPILGQLFRSKNLNHSVSELVIVVTATVIDPLQVAPPQASPAFPIPFLNAPHFDDGLTPSKSNQADQH